MDALILPAPTEVATSLWEDRALLGRDLAVTGQEVLVGLAAAVALGARSASACTSPPPSAARCGRS